MFHVGDYIVYGSNGICRVEEITHPDIAGIDVQTNRILPQISVIVHVVREFRIDRQ